MPCCVCRIPGSSSLQLAVGLLDPEAIDAHRPRRGGAGDGRDRARLLRRRAAEARRRPGGTEGHEPEVAADWRSVSGSPSGTAAALLEMALQFVLGMDGVTVTLVGMRTAKHLADNLRYAAAPRLSQEELAASLRAALPFSSAASMPRE